MPRFGDINQPYKRVPTCRIKSVINYLPRCTYHLLYKDCRANLCLAWAPDRNPSHDLRNQTIVFNFQMPLANKSPILLKCFRYSGVYSLDHDCIGVRMKRRFFTNLRSVEYLPFVFKSSSTISCLLFYL